MEKLVDLGLVRHIGTSNMTIPKLKLLLRDARIKPAVNEMELHPHFQQPELFEFLRANGIVPVGYCPIGSPAGRSATARRKTRCRLEDPVIVADCPAPRRASGSGLREVGGAARADAHPVLGQPRTTTWPISKASSSDPLTDAEMAAIARIDRNCRLIKGQVFLWKDGQTWEDLWDVNGEITPP